MAATVHSGESIPDIAGDVVARVVRHLVRELDDVQWTAFKQGHETVEITTREVIEAYVWDRFDALRDLATLRLREHVQEVAR